MQNKKKKFDSVKMMREIRDELSERYLKNPNLEKKDLEKIRKKYGIRVNKTKESLTV